MTKNKTISVRISKELAKQFDDVCELLKIDKSAFLRACLVKLTLDPDSILPLLGYSKRKVWVKRGENP